MSTPRMRFTPGDVTSARPTISGLIDRYDAWYRVRHPEADLVDVANLDLLLTWKVGHDDGCLDTWSTDQLEGFLAWCPGHVSVSDAGVPGLLTGVAEVFTFLAHEKLLSTWSEAGDRLAARTQALAGEFGVLPVEVHSAPTDRTPAPDDEDEDVPAVGPVLLPDDDAVRAGAAAAPVLAGFAALTEYFRAPGRALTATGNLKLADAQALSAVLGTEPLETTIGRSTFRARSATSLPELSHWQWWAREAGALRVRHGRLVGVEAWRKRLAADPVGTARRATQALLDHGAVTSYLTHAPWPTTRLVDLLTSQFFAILLATPRPVPVEAFVEAVDEARDEMSVRSSMGAVVDPRESARTVIRLLALLERAGLVVQHEVTDGLSERRTGGTVELTPFGVVTAVEVLRDAGLEVVTIENPLTMTSAELADLAGHDGVAPSVWWAALSAWLEPRPDRQAALQTLLDDLAARDALFAVMGLPIPEPIEEDLAPTMQRVRETHLATDVLGAVALTWLIEHGRLDPAVVPPADLMTSSLTWLALLATHDPPAVLDALGTDLPRRTLLDLVSEVSRRLPPNAHALLDAISRHHPDATVARAARKELMRMRSPGPT